MNYWLIYRYGPQGAFQFADFPCFDALQAFIAGHTSPSTAGIEVLRLIEGGRRVHVSIDWGCTVSLLDDESLLVVDEVDVEDDDEG